MIITVSITFAIVIAVIVIITIIINENIYNHHHHNNHHNNDQELFVNPQMIKMVVTNTVHQVHINIF